MAATAASVTVLYIFVWLGVYLMPHAATQSADSDAHRNTNGIIIQYQYTLCMYHVTAGPPQEPCAISLFLSVATYSPIYFVQLIFSIFQKLNFKMFEVF